MKRLKDDERIIGPMFPRLHVNDTDKGGPKAPPRNKMAIYEQLSVPSQRFNHAPNNSLANLRSISTQGSGDERGMFFSHRQPSKELPEKQYSDLSTQVDQRKKSDEDDFTVPIFTQSVPNQENGKHCNETTPSYLNHTSKCQKATKTSVITQIMRQEGKIQNEENMAALDKRDSSRLKSFPSEYVNDVSNNTESIEDGSFRSMQTKNLERGDSVTSVLDCVSGLDITPDDVVGIIGQKRFWKARRTIAHQQRVFAVQVFELHRLIKVQKLIAASPHLLLENSSFLTEPIKPLPRKKSRKIDPDEPTHKPKISTENTLEKKSSFSSIQNDNQNGGPWCFNQPHVPHWLIPVMSPSEGLIYKPYPGPGFFAPGPEGGGPQGSNPTMNNLPIPAYGVLGPHQFPSFPLAGPPGYPLGMPVMNPAPFVVEQMNGPDFLDEIEDNGLQASTAGSNAHKPEHERPTTVIKVVPHNAKTATESAARIFRAIQEERKRYNAP